MWVLPYRLRIGSSYESVAMFPEAEDEPDPRSRDDESDQCLHKKFCFIKTLKGNVYLLMLLRSTHMCLAVFRLRCRSRWG